MFKSKKLKKYCCIFIVSIFLFSLFSCKKEVDIDKFIENYRNVDFSDFKNAVITYRTSKKNTDVFVLSRYGSNSFYYIYYNHSDNKIDHIYTPKHGKEADFSNKEIEIMFDKNSKYDFFLIGGDNNGNIFINPFYANARPYFLRLKRKSKSEFIKKGFYYKHYKDKWYININYIKDENLDYEKIKREADSIE